MKKTTPEPIKICWQCKNAQYGEELGFYEILCIFDKTIHDENSSCEHFVYDPNHSEINPRIKPRENDDIPWERYMIIYNGEAYNPKFFKVVKREDLQRWKNIMRVERRIKEEKYIEEEYGIE